jgi:aspartate/methionine/tyrosine aminotransferase
LHLSPLVERIAIHAVANADSLLRPRLAEARINLQILAGWVRHHELAVQWVHPQGGVCTLLRFPDVPEVTSFCETLARQYGVLVVPGACFDQPSCVRVGFGGATSQLNEGLRRLATALDAVHDGQRTAATH